MIECSAGKGKFTTQDCLACSLKSPECGYSYPLLAAIYDKEEDRSKEIHVTDLCGCIRKAYYDKRFPTPEMPHNILVRWLGVMTHAALERNDGTVKSELPLEWGNIVGRCDAVLNGTTLLDYKTVRWLYKSKTPYGSHSLQVNIYAYILKKMGHDIDRLQIQYIDMSGPSRCRCGFLPEYLMGELVCPNCHKTMTANSHQGAALVDVPFMSEDYIETIISERSADLQIALDTGIEPYANSGYTCNYCSHSDRCKEKYITEE